MKIESGRTFINERGRLLKKYRSIADDVEALVDELRKNTNLGSFLGKKCRKIRMAITSKGTGKSGGARVLAYVAIVEDRAVLHTLYDKAEREDISHGELDAQLAENGLK